MTGRVDVLAIGAHPDDAEVGCGGTLILAADSGLRVAVADLTLGESASRGTPEERESERLQAAEILGLSARQMLGLPDGRVGTDPEHRTVLVQLLRELRPSIVLAPYPEDRHPDHAAAGTLAREASFLSGLPRVGEGSSYRPAHVYHYMLHQPFTPSFVVDVSPVWDRKWDAVRAHRSQFDAVGEPGTIDVARFLEVVEARATLHGAMMGVDRAEAFHYPGPVPLTGLPGLRPETQGGRPFPLGYQIFH